MNTDRDTEGRPPCEDGGETRVMLSEAREHLGLSKAKRAKETPSPRNFGGNVALLHHNLGLSAFRTVREYVSSV